MNIMVADITDHPEVEVADPVVLLGQHGQTRVTAEELAEMSGSINYELRARIGAHIPRVVL